MRRTLIQHVLPCIFCLVPLLAAVLIAVAIPAQAQEFYRLQVYRSPMDWLILGLGIVVFSLQLALSWRALQWRGTAFDDRADRWLTYLAQAAEWFPLLGLLGTVAGILQTFSDLAQQTGQVEPKRIIALYAPAITATGSGLFMALLNIFPTWIVVIGRELIMAVGGGGELPAEEETSA